jgi:hypothetical protein
VRVQRERELPAQRRHPLGARRRPSSKAARLGPEHDVLGHGQGLDDRRPLHHGADAKTQRGPGGGDLPGLALDEDLAAAGPFQPSQESEQGRLAGAAPPDQGVQLA